MEKQKVITVNNQQWRLNVPSIQSKTKAYSVLSVMTSGQYDNMVRSSNKDIRDTADLAFKSSILQANVEKLNKDGEVDYEFYFFELQEEDKDLINKLYKEWSDFSSSFRKDTHPEE